MKRIDSRSATAIRTMSSASGLLKRSDGSAKFQFGNSVVLAAVLGPVQAKQRQELISEAFINVVITPLSGSGGTAERRLEGILKKTCSYLIPIALFPRTLIKITLQIMAIDGPILATCINALILALLDAGIPLNSTVASATVMIQKDGHVLLDPTELEIKVLAPV